MANTVVLKRSAVPNKTPTTSDLALGELALNTNDGNLFFKKDASGTQSILSVATLTGAQTLTNKTLVEPLIATVGGDEGGQINFGAAATNTTLVGNINVDIYRNQFRIFEGGGSNRGVSIDLSTTSESVGSLLVTNNGTQTLTNKTLSSPVLSGAVVINGLTYPNIDGVAGQVLSTTGTGQLVFATVSGDGGVVVGGYNNSSLTAFPAGDYNGTDAFIGASGSAFDAFGVSLLATFTCMDPVGSTQTTDLGVLT
jgi:hypothetical protein